MGEIYEYLLKVKNGYDPGWGGLSYVDDLLYQIDFNQKNPGLSIVTIQFDDYESYLDLFEDIDYNDKHTIRDFLNKNYNDNHYDDASSMIDSWNGGVYYQYFNEENREKMEKIFLFISKKSDLSTEEKLKLFSDDFDSVVLDIAREYESLWKSCIDDKLYDSMIDEFANKFHYVGIREMYPLYKYKVSVNILLKLFELFNIKDGDLSDLLKKIISKFDTHSHGYGYDEEYYNTHCDDFDVDSFNRNSEWYIDRVLDDLMDDEKFSDVDEYFEVKSAIEKEYGFDKWNEIPRSKNVYFKVDDVSPETNKIIITIKTAEGKEEKRSLTYDELKQMEGQYELFNEIKKIKKFFVI